MITVRFCINGCDLGRFETRVFTLKPGGKATSILRGSVRTQKKPWQGDRCWGMLVESNHLNHLHKEQPKHCPYCPSTVTKERTKKTSLDYRTLCASASKR